MWVESTAVGITAVSIPAAEIMGSATVSEHFPRQEISLIATTRFCKLFHSLFRTKTFKRTNFAVRFTGGAYIPAEKHRAMTKRVGFFGRQQLSHFGFNLQRHGCINQPQAVAKPYKMRIGNHGGLPKISPHTRFAVFCLFRAGGSVPQ